MENIDFFHSSYKLKSNIIYKLGNGNVFDVLQKGKQVRGLSTEPSFLVF